MPTQLDTRDLWATTYSNCSAQPTSDINFEQAQFILSIHAGHGPSCAPFLTAQARLSTVIG